MDKENDYISLRNINKIYPNKFQAIFDFNLDIKKHEFIVLVGPSGCGKSTLLRMLAGLEDISSGVLTINGVYANDLEPKDRDLAMVFQSYALYPQMSVYNNLAFGLKMRKKLVPVLDSEGKQVVRIDEKKLHGIGKALKDIDHDIAKLHSHIAKLEERQGGEKTRPLLAMKMSKAIEDEGRIIDRLTLNKAKLQQDHDYYAKNQVPVYERKHYSKEEIKSRVMNAAKILEIEENLDRKPKELSGGQRQRVALGRAIVRNAKIFLMDEPLSNLDAKLRVSMRSEIIKLHKRIESTTVYVTHDQTEAMTMADRIVVMKRGIVQQIATPAEIYNNPANLFVATFIGSPAMNILDATYKDGLITFKNGLTMVLTDTEKARYKDHYRNECARIARELPKLEKRLAVDSDALEKSTLKRDRAALEQKVSGLKGMIAKGQELVAKYTAYLANTPNELKFGIRPEDIHMADPKDTDIFKLKVTVPELLGNEYYIHGIVGNEKLTCKVPAVKNITMDETIAVKMDKSRIKLFDSDSEKIIC